MILVTGGAGFIGSNFVLHWIREEKTPLINLDKLTYAGNLNNLAELEHNSLHKFVQGDIRNRQLIQELLQLHRPSAVVHFAAETHVDRSIYHPEHFIQTNVLGTFDLLDETYSYWKNLTQSEQQSFRFLHVSTDEVFGSLKPGDPPSKEGGPYAPNSPYAASKAASDHFFRAYYQTYGFPAITTHCSNNYGPFQFPEKLIPLMIINALQGKPLPIYGDGKNIRNWIYVEDHCEALRLVLAKGKAGETYNIGDNQEYTNLSVVNTICSILDELKPDSHVPHASLITHVKDRPGHDRRYALDCSKISRTLGWRPRDTFANNIKKTVAWYLRNMSWIENVISGEYRDWVRTHYAGTENK